MLTQEYRLIMMVNTKNNETFNEAHSTTYIKCGKCGWQCWNPYCADCFNYCSGCGRKFVKLKKVKVKENAK